MSGPSRHRVLALLLLCAACSGEPAEVDAAPSEEEEGGELLEWERLDGPPTFEVVVPWQEAHQHVGSRIAAEGRVVATHNSGRACFLNFDEDWRGKFHAVIFASSFRDFPEAPEEHFLNRNIRLIGEVEVHRGAPQIVVESPEQIQLLAD